MRIKTQKHQEFLAAGDASQHQKVFIHKKFLRTSAQGYLDTGHAAACLCRICTGKGGSDKT